MADFSPAFEKMIEDEGGYLLHAVAGDRCGMTYAGIARKMNPQWPGWQYIDRGEIPPSDLVRQFYRDGYWIPLQGDAITTQSVAETIFNFAVNTSAPGRPVVAVKLAQLVVGATPDGALGAKTLAAINGFNEALFEASYALAKVARYRDIVLRDRTQLKFLLGWINRTLEQLK